jgi:sulfur carrier protein
MAKRVFTYPLARLLLTRRTRRPNVAQLAMQITVNGDAQEVPDGLTVRGLVEHLGLTDGPVAVERNREVVPRAEHPSTPLSAGDMLEIVHFVGGG